MLLDEGNFVDSRPTLLHINDLILIRINFRHPIDIIIRNILDQLVNVKFVIPLVRKPLHNRDVQEHLGLGLFRSGVIRHTVQLIALKEQRKLRRFRTRIFRNMHSTCVNGLWPVHL